MSVFQLVALAMLAFLFAGTVTMAFRHQLAGRVGSLWAAIWIAAAVAIVWPNTTRVVAQVLGIGRGADVVLYAFVLIVLIGFYTVYLRLRRLDANLTLLVRHLALQNAAAPEDGAQGGPDVERR